MALLHTSILGMLKSRIRFSVDQRSLDIADLVTTIIITIVN